MKSNIIRLAILLVIVWVWLPTGASDIFIIPYIINKIGLHMYIIISIILVGYLYKTIEGRTLGEKISNIKAELSRLIR